MAVYIFSPNRSLIHPITTYSSQTQSTSLRVLLNIILARFANTDSTLSKDPSNLLIYLKARFSFVYFSSLVSKYPFLRNNCYFIMFILMLFDSWDFVKDKILSSHCSASESMVSVVCLPIKDSRVRIGWGMAWVTNLRDLDKCLRFEMIFYMIDRFSDNSSMSISREGMISWFHLDVIFKSNWSDRIWLFWWEILPFDLIRSFLKVSNFFSIWRDSPDIKFKSIGFLFLEYLPIVSENL